MAKRLDIKLKAGRYMVKSTLTFSGGRIYVGFPYNKTLLAQVKAMVGAKYHGFDPTPRKIWSVKVCRRNLFRLAVMQGQDMFGVYDKPLMDYTTQRTLYAHQLEMVRFCLTRRHCILAGEMGTGKTLVAIEVMEYIKQTEGLTDYEAWYVGPRAGVRAVSREISKWKADVKPMMYTYEAFTKLIETWSETDVLPKVIIFDESSKLKTPTSKRSQAALYVAEHLMEQHGDKSAVIEMTGTPAPKAPTDWFHQAEVACPGFLMEGHIHAMKARLSLIEERQSASGGAYPHIVTWLDDETKCAVCGQFADHVNHDKDATIFGGDASKIHTFEPSVNEVSKLYRRLKGLVHIQMKKNCLDLPDKQYRVIKVTPTQETLRAAKLIKAKTTRAIQAFTLLRELSDGFQYTEEIVGYVECPECYGVGTIDDTVPLERELTKAQDYDKSNYTQETVTCYCCSGKKEVPQYKRSTDSYSSPKDQVYLDLLDEYGDLGRFVVWGGFTGTIERLLAMAQQHGWHTLRYDKIVAGFDPHGNDVSVDDLLDAMDNSHPRYKELQDKYPKVCFVGHPDAGGMALTLHASPVALYYSNSFKGESRIQSEDRIHRLGMDNNKGATIIDLVHLKTDLMVLDNLRNKKKLQNMTMNVLEDAFVSSDIEMERYEG